jgi:hypothetical protein
VFVAEERQEKEKRNLMDCTHTQSVAFLSIAEGKKRKRRRRWAFKLFA